MPDKICFSYLSDAPLGIRHRSATQQTLRGYQRTPNGSPSGCFSFTPDAPLGIANPDAVPQDIRDPRRMPGGNPSGCFSYQA